MGNVSLKGLFRKIGKERGKSNEDRFFEVFKGYRVPTEFPPWFSGIQKSTREQDYFRRIDAVAFTSDVGKIYLQIKSSKSGVKKFEEHQEKHPQSEWVFPIIIRSTDTDAEIAKNTRRVLSRARQEILKRRNRSH